MAERSGTSGRRLGALAVAGVTVAAVGIPLAAIANPDRQQAFEQAFVHSNVISSVRRNPDALVRVIVQGRGRADTAKVADEVAKGIGDDSSGERLTGRFQSITGVAATLSGRHVRSLARDRAVETITPDVSMVPDEPVGASTAALSREAWIAQAGLRSALRATAVARATPPTIAIVGSGVDPRRSFYRYVTADVSVTRLAPNSPGHGTLVASLAADAAPTAPLVSIDVMNDHGKAMASDVIAAADWILQNRDRYRIRVAVFSMRSTRSSSFQTDPLNRAVERLWHAGVVVVAAAGNDGTDRVPSGVRFAPADDPFVITVGATDLGSSAHGRTPDGFLKPDLGAPGMSGSSSSAAIVAGAAAEVLALHPDWTPDHVKGALMATARRVGLADEQAAGMGQLDARAAQQLEVPPNPNRSLNRFLMHDPSSGPIPVFDSASWQSAIKRDASWDSASWTDASWADASWADVSWVG